MLNLLGSDSQKDWAGVLDVEEIEKFYANEICFSFIEEDSVIIKGDSKKIKRVYVRDKDRSDDGVGWVLLSDIDRCMICNDEFNMYCWPHHCRACGNVICAKCSPDQAELVEFPEFGEQRVCVLCFYGQAQVHASHIRMRWV